jgi:hypothetical protein
VCIPKRRIRHASKHLLAMFVSPVPRSLINHMQIRQATVNLLAGLVHAYTCEMTSHGQLKNAVVDVGCKPV